MQIEYTKSGADRYVRGGHKWAKINAKNAEGRWLVVYGYAGQTKACSELPNLCGKLWEAKMFAEMWVKDQ